MTTPELIASLVGSSLTSLGLGGITLRWLNRRKENAEARKLSADSLASEDVANEELYKANRKLRIKIVAYENALEICRRQKEVLQDELIRALKKG